jgi:hypothetical protein
MSLWVLRCENFRIVVAAPGVPDRHSWSCESAALAYSECVELDLLKSPLRPQIV